MWSYDTDTYILKSRCIIIELGKSNKYTAEKKDNYTLDVNSKKIIIILGKIEEFLTRKYAKVRPTFS